MSVYDDPPSSRDSRWYHVVAGVAFAIMFFGPFFYLPWLDLYGGDITVWWLAGWLSPIVVVSLVDLALWLRSRSGPAGSRLL